MLSNNWQVRQGGHVAEHNRIADRINGAAVYVTTLEGWAIQSAIDVVAAAGGGTVQLLRGQYTLTATLNLSWRVKLIGAGMYATTLLAVAPMDAMIRVTDAAATGFTRIDSLGLDGDNLAQHGVEWYHTGYNDLESVRVFDCVQYGLYIHGGVWGCNARRLRAYQCFNGIHVVGDAANQANDNTFEHCTLGTNRGAGMRLSGGTGTKVSYTDFELNCTGGTEQAGLLQTGGGQCLNVMHCHFERNGLEATRGSNIQIGSDADNAHQAPVMIGNYLYGGVLGGGDTAGECDYAVTLANTQAALVQGNRAWGHVVEGLHLVGSLNANYVAQANVWT